jgi:polyphenol oxidase
MIRPPGWSGVAFSERSDGDVRSDPEIRRAVAEVLGVGDDWAELTQVHGNAVIEVAGPGVGGEADAIWTTKRDLPLAVFTADCFGVVLLSDEAVGLAHAGWRGVASGVVGKLLETMSGEGHAPTRAALGAGIGACCFEVGPEVADQFTDVSSTTWGTSSVDLRAAISSQLAGLEIWAAEACTFHEPRWFSHRADATTQRLATIGWIP